jgi:omega-6 fatty acid desaturase (delta-12 desaturase)
MDRTLTIPAGPALYDWAVPVQSTSVSSPLPARSWSARLAPYRGPDLRRSVWQLASTASLFVLAWTLMYASLRVSYALTLLLAVPTAFLLVRLFIIQHDCGHGSFFKSARASNVVGAVLGVFTMTPYQYWRRTHAMHHATSGNLEHRGHGDIDTLTVREYLARDRWGRFTYRVYRHPLVLFGIGAVLQFVVTHRLPTIVPRTWTRERRSILLTDVALVLVIVALGSLIGFTTLLWVHGPVVVISCSIGVWLFYVQHQFEPTYWEHDEQWAFDAAALQGSSYYELPPLLQWLTGNIGLHHVHHLSAGIPNYRLQQVLDDCPELRAVTRITLRESLRCVSLGLWDEESRRLVPFPRSSGARAA